MVCRYLGPDARNGDDLRAGVPWFRLGLDIGFGRVDGLLDRFDAPVRLGLDESVLDLTPNGEDGRGW
jgi:hypothetical protein